MCGIAGAFAENGEQALDRVTLLAMLAAQRQRGPDGCGLYLGQSVAMGTVRLAINDVAGGDQPFLSDSGTVICCYNGEIYNAPALRRELADRGCRFPSRCDGAIIANLYALDGVEGLKRLDGQFALALWDIATASGVLARDEFGVLPLFFAPFARRLVFASTVRALIAEPAITSKIDIGAIMDCCVFWSAVGRDTVLDQVKAVLPGEILTVRGGLATSRYRRFQLPLPGDGDAGPAPGQAEINALLANAVRRRIPDEVPFGVYLSGGVDSALIAACVAREHPAPTALSVTFPGSRRDEAAEQRETAKALNLRHLTIACTPEDVAVNFHAAVLNIEAPVIRTAPVGTYLLSRMARDNGVKVVLTGEGADEIFSGYDIYRSIQVVEHLKRGAAIEDLLSAAEREDWLTRDPFAQVSFPQGAADGAIDEQVAMLPAGPFGVHLLRWTNGCRLVQLMASDLRHSFDLGARCTAMSASLPAGFADADPLTRAALLDLNTLLAGYLLSSQGDRMAMAHSVELRVPFLDRALVRRVWQMPWGERMPGAVTKRALRRALDGMVPDAIRLRPKKAFSATDFVLGDPDVWRSLEPYLSPGAVRRFGLFDPARVEALVGEARGSGAHRNDFVSPFAFVASVHMLADYVASASAGRDTAPLALEPNREFRDVMGRIVRLP